MSLSMIPASTHTKVTKKGPTRVRAVANYTPFDPKLLASACSVTRDLGANCLTLEIGKSYLDPARIDVEADGISAVMIVMPMRHDREVQPCR
jgi:hypothetical protein